jgi:hypothetical protein
MLKQVKKLEVCKKGCLSLNRIQSKFTSADEYASSISIFMAYSKVKDDICDGKSIFNHLRFGLIKKKAEAAIKNLEELRFPATATSQLIDNQKKLERAESPLLECVKPTETVTARVFAHTAILSSQTSNYEAMEAMGKHIGRIMYITDNYLDLKEDLLRDNFNPLLNEFRISNTLSLEDLKRIKKYCVNLARESLKNISIQLKKTKLKLYNNFIHEILMDGLRKK